ncbi:RNA-binding protein, putative [Plasmodium vinckei]|uniref:RNA-binding protein, putative n=1 Tax=Plasmodium vinckei TaxID=5860 RepID=A0A6V7TJY4_PLAVN|nr:RNA-binding protein, putative [Plasmodium vinckei]
MRIVHLFVFIYILLFESKKHKIQSYKISKGVKSYNCLSFSKNDDILSSKNAIGDDKLTKRENIFNKKGRYSFSPIKKSSIKDIQKRIRYSNKNIKLKNNKFFRKKEIHKSLIDNINKEVLSENIASIGRNNINENENSQNILPLPLTNAEEQGYNCLLLCKGLPFHVSDDEIIKFFSPYKIMNKYIIYIKDKNGNFFGDILVRFQDKEQKELALKNKNFKFLLHRYIQIYNVNEEHYEEYYNIGYKNPPSYKNYVPIKNVIVPNYLDKDSNIEDESATTLFDNSMLDPNNINDNSYEYNDEDTIWIKEHINKKGILLENLYTGKKLIGKITSVHPYGVFIDCDVYVKISKNKFIKILALLHKNKLTINIGLPSDPLEEQEQKELILEKNMNIIVYVDKIIKKKYDINDAKENNLIFFNLTLDSSITEEKIKWFQKNKLKKDMLLKNSTQNEITSFDQVTRTNFKEASLLHKDNKPMNRSNRLFFINKIHDKYDYFIKLKNRNKRKTAKYVLFNNENEEISQDSKNGKQTDDKCIKKGAKKIKIKKNKLASNELFDDENDEFDDIFNFQNNEIDTLEEQQNESSKIELSEQDENNMVESVNVKIKEKGMNNYNEEMDGILKSIFSDNTNDKDIKIKGKNNKEKKKENSQKINHIKNEDEIRENIKMSNLENINERAQWTNDIRKEESIFYSKLFGLKTDINDFYSENDLKHDQNENPTKNSDDAESYSNVMNDKNDDYVMDDENESNKNEKNNEDHVKNETSDVSIDKDIHINTKLNNKNENFLNILENNNDEVLDFSNLSKMSIEELKNNIYKKNYLLPIDVSKESLKSRLIEISVCEKKKVKFDNFPYIRYYLFDFYLSTEEIKLIILCNKKFLNKKNINKTFLDSLKINELKYLLHQSMENFRLWDPKDSIKKKILNLNKDLLLKQNLTNVENIQPNNLIILWNDFKDYMLNCVYVHDDGNYNILDELENEDFEDSDESFDKYDTTNNNENKYVNIYVSRMKRIEKEGFLLNNDIPFCGTLEKEKNIDENKNKYNNLDPFKNAFMSLEKQLQSEEDHDLPDKIDLKEAMKILNDKSHLKKLKRFFNNESEKDDQNYIQKIIQHILKNKQYFDHYIDEDLLKKMPYDELIVSMKTIMLDKLPANVLEDLL